MSNGELSYKLLIPPMIIFFCCQTAVYVPHARPRACPPPAALRRHLLTRSFCLGLYKCWTMGILPSGPADWLQFEARPPVPEWSAVRALMFG